MGVGGQHHAPATLPPGKTWYPWEDGWAPGPAWTFAENLAPTGIQTPDRPACSKLLYRLRYPSPQFILYMVIELVVDGCGLLCWVSE